MTTDTPAWDGVPMNPERNGAHWIIGWNNSPFVAEWQADPNAEFGGDYGWTYDGGDRPDGIVANGWTYGGPCLTPSEVAAREAAAWAAGAAAMKHDTERACNSHGNTLAANGLPMSAISVARTCAVIAGTLPLPPMPVTTRGGANHE